MNNELEEMQMEVVVVWFDICLEPRSRVRRDSAAPWTLPPSLPFTCVTVQIAGLEMFWYQNLQDRGHQGNLPSTRMNLPEIGWQRV